MKICQLPLWRNMKNKQRRWSFLGDPIDTLQKDIILLSPFLLPILLFRSLSFPLQLSLSIAHFDRSLVRRLPRAPTILMIDRQGTRAIVQQLAYQPERGSSFSPRFLLLLVLCRVLARRKPRFSGSFYRAVSTLSPCPSQRAERFKRGRTLTIHGASSCCVTIQLRRGTVLW